MLNPSLLIIAEACLLGRLLAALSSSSPGARLSDCPPVCSNLGGNTINEVALDFWRAGRAREEISMEFLEQRLRLELLEPAGESWARLQDAVGRPSANLPLHASSGPCVGGTMRLVLHKCVCCGASLYSDTHPGVICNVSPFLHLHKHSPASVVPLQQRGAGGGSVTPPCPFSPENGQVARGSVTL